MLHVLARIALATIGAIVIAAFIFAYVEGIFDGIVEHFSRESN